MALRAMIHPKLHEALPDHYPASCTIQVNTPTRDDKGQPIAAWSDLAGHVEIPCAVSEAGSTERRNLWGTYPEAEKMIALGGSYPDITTIHSAVTGGVRYDILGTLDDSQSASGYLMVRRVR